MPAEEARKREKKVPRGDLASVAPANVAASKEEFLAKKASLDDGDAVCSSFLHKLP
jgi:hypothetical protein